jgi:hypothetical protein
MNRKFLRITLIGLIALAALASVWPAVSAGLGIKLDVKAPTTSSANAGSNQLDRSKSRLGSCTTTHHGVTLVVDFGSSSDAQPLTVCAESSPADGWKLFKAAGVKVAGTAQYPVGFVCRINDYPSLADQDCEQTPTAAEGSWVYFTASAKTNFHDWRFSMVGASMNRPECGDVQGWRFVKASDGSNTKYPRVKPEPFKCAN